MKLPVLAPPNFGTPDGAELPAGLKPNAGAPDAALVVAAVVGLKPPVAGASDGADVSLANNPEAAPFVGVPAAFENKLDVLDAAGVDALKRLVEDVADAPNRFFVGAGLAVDPPKKLLVPGDCCSPPWPSMLWNLLTVLLDSPFNLVRFSFSWSSAGAALRLFVPSAGNLPCS